MSEHGTYDTGCRCDDCRAMHAARCKRYWLLARVERGGKPQRPMRVSVTAVAEHLTALLDSGWTRAAVEREAGLACSHVSKILGGRQQTVHRKVTARILALQPLTPVDVDPVVVERLARPGVSWRDMPCTRAERIAALELVRDRAGTLRADLLAAGWGDQQIEGEGLWAAARRLGLNIDRDLQHREAVVSNV